VSASFAQACCADRPAVGRRVEWQGRSREIVGVVRDVVDWALDQAPFPAVYAPIDDPMTGFYSVTYLLRTDRPSASLAAAILTEVHAVSPQATIADSSLMRDRLMRSVRDRSFATLIVIFCALAAIGVSAAGIVGIVGSVVARRTREIAIRVALGAQRADVRRLVTREAVMASTLGAVIGLAAGAGLSRTMTSLLFGIAPGDPISMVLSALALVAIVAVAAWIPARRAVRLSPTDALRVE
jgi:putative ABC transport system permease protein